VNLRPIRLPIGVISPKKELAADGSRDGAAVLATLTAARSIAGAKIRGAVRRSVVDQAAHFVGAGGAGWAKSTSISSINGSTIPALALRHYALRHYGDAISIAQLLNERSSAASRRPRLAARALRGRHINWHYGDMIRIAEYRGSRNAVVWK
jgi:hypothetical protein